MHFHVFTLQYHLISKYLNSCLLQDKVDKKMMELGVFLAQSVCAHGPLYTAFSRGKCARGRRVFVGDHKDGLTDNIVYSELH